MKYIEVDEELYRFIAGKTERIGESASDILRRLLGLDVTAVEPKAPVELSQPSMEQGYRPNTLPEVESTLDFDNLFSSAAIEAQKGAVGRFLFALECLYNQDQQGFEQVLQVQGRDRLYFATSKEALLKASKSANPKEVGSSGFWVTTNNNTAKKHTILSEVLEKMGCDGDKAKAIADKALPLKA
ncbi:replication initiation negative regulator SeqA [Shewanella algae]|uniref:replication initiation negative regulator SeqA n=1 Tax=Shewanella algae TaxID=38313 RepID=UPI000B8A858A|nr:replication initiation negative regulator SeqA [Shewanella algae]OXS00867.1 N-carbamyl-L-amino acid amidohydrolase [Shewanella algae]